MGGAAVCVHSGTSRCIRDVETWLHAHWKLWLKCFLCCGTIASPSPSSLVTDLCWWWWESGGMASRRKTPCVMLMRAVRTHPSSPGCFVSPACPTRCLLTLWRSWLSHSPPPERIKRHWAISPLSAPAHSGGGGGRELRQCPQLAFFVLACLSFPLPLFLLLALAKGYARSCSFLSSLFTLSIALAPAARENSSVEMSPHLLCSVVHCVPLQTAVFGWRCVHHKRVHLKKRRCKRDGEFLMN